VAGEEANSISILHGRSAGSSRRRRRSPASTTRSRSRAAKLAGDHYTDLVCTTDDGISVFRGKKGGKFHGEETYAAGEGPNDVIVGRVDKDRKPDVVVADYSSGRVFLLRGKGHGKLGDAKPYPAVSNSAAGVRFIDYDGDKHRDLAVTDSNNPGSVSILLGKSHGFEAPKSFPVDVDPYGLAVGRFDEDKRQDIAASSYDPGAISILLSK